MVTNNEWRKKFTEQFGFDVSEFVILARSKDGKELQRIYSGDSIILAGLGSQFVNYVNNIGSKEYLDISPSKN